MKPVRIIVLFGTLVALLVSFAAASGVSLGVDGGMNGQVYLTDSAVQDDGPASWTVEAKNLGSTPFTARFRLDVRQNNTTIFRTWSPVTEVMPGSITAKTLVFDDPAVTGNLTAAVTLHHGTRRATVTESFTVERRAVTDGFDVDRIRTKRDHIAFDISAPDDVETFHVTVDGASTRRYAQRTVYNAGTRETVTVPYHPVIVDDTDATVTVSSRDGTYYTREQMTLRRTSGWSAMLDGLTGNLVQTVTGFFR